MLPDDPYAAIGIVLILLLALSWHEAAHAWVADRLGDPTARLLGRVTLNPIKHIDPFLSIILPALMFYTAGIAVGGGKPVPINVMNFRRKARDFMLVALAGPGANLLLALLFTLLYVVSAWTGLLAPVRVESTGFRPLELPHPFYPWHSYHSISELWLKAGVLINLALAMFNMLPIPPLDGSRVIGWLLPRAFQRGWYSLDRVGFLVILVLFFAFGGISYVGYGLILTFDTVGIAIDQVLALKPIA